MKKLLVLILILILSGNWVFAQLPENNITTTLVGNAIGNISRDVGTLCTSATINKWSRKKPVDQHGTPNWWEATNPLYGGSGTDKFSISVSPLTYGLGRSTQTPPDPLGLNYDANSFWTYNRPRGDYTLYPLSGFRLGDFRGYEHAAEKTLAVTNAPEGEQVGYPSSSFEYSSAPATTGGLSVVDFGMQNYYFGVLVQWGATYENSAIMTVDETASSLTKTTIPFDYTLVPFNRYEGNYRWITFVCASKLRAINPPFWMTLQAAVTAYPEAVLYVMPTEDGYANKGTFYASVASVAANPTSLNFSWLGQSATTAITVTPNSLRTLVSTSDTWITVDDNDHQSDNPYTLTIYVSKNLSGVTRNGTVRVYEYGNYDNVYAIINISQLVEGI